MRIDGFWRTRDVLVDGRPLQPEPSQRLWNHSPEGFNWGYGGSGPAQLALALLLQAGLEPDRAVALHQSFKCDHVATWPQDDIVVDIDIVAWVARQT